MTDDALTRLCRELTAERFAKPVPEWHQPRTDAVAEAAAALRLVVHNDPAQGMDEEEAG